MFPLKVKTKKQETIFTSILHFALQRSKFHVTRVRLYSEVILFSLVFVLQVRLLCAIKIKTKSDHNLLARTFRRLAAVTEFVSSSIWLIEFFVYLVIVHSDYIGSR